MASLRALAKLGEGARPLLADVLALVDVPGLWLERAMALRTLASLGRLTPELVTRVVRVLEGEEGAIDRDEEDRLPEQSLYGYLLEEPAVEAAAALASAPPEDERVRRALVAAASPAPEGEWKDIDLASVIREVLDH